MLGPLGVRVELRVVPWDKFVAEVEGQAAFSINGFFSRPTVDAALYPWYHSQGSWNLGLWHYRNERVDRLLEQARQTRDRSARSKIYQEFQRLVVADDPPSVVPYVLNHVNGFRREVKELHSSPMMWLDLRRVHLAR
jgi:peptide/nickel transport system substrate-binding protein